MYKRPEDQGLRNSGLLEKSRAQVQGPTCVSKARPICLTSVCSYTTEMCHDEEDSMKPETVSSVSDKRGRGKKRFQKPRRI